jgi:hypothetical protein
VKRVVADAPVVARCKMLWMNPIAIAPSYAMIIRA